MGATLVLMRDATASRPVLLLLLSPRYATAPGPVLLLLRLPRHATAAKNHTVVHLMTSASPGPPVPITTADTFGFGSPAGVPAAGPSFAISRALR